MFAVIYPEAEKQNSQQITMCLHLVGNRSLENYACNHAGKFRAGIRIERPHGLEINELAGLCCRYLTLRQKA